ncbi:hypothetical protein V1527DRAFT_470279, partial [Lipomyces starkeyi]
MRCLIQNLVVDLHCQIAKYLCTRHSILSSYRPLRMVRRRVDAGGSGPRQHKLWQIGPLTNSNNNSTKRENINLAKSSWYLRPRLVKTCGRYGSINDVGSSKKYACKQCQFECDGDVKWCEKYSGSLQYSEPG